MKQARPGVIVIGAGIAGLAAAVDLSRHDMAVTVVERAASPGGKLREAVLGDARIDSGPTVLTLRRVLDELFADAGASLDVALRLTPAEVLGRHAWQDGTTLDLHADAARSAEAIAAFAGAAAADGFRAFRARARQVFATLDGSFMHAARPTIWSLLRNGGLRGLPDLWRISPYSTLWSALGRHFTDPRLRQMFARYATYSGASPFRAPATLMLIADAEQQGVWLVEGGMQRLAEVLTNLACGCGAELRCDSEVAAVTTAGGRVSGVRLASGEWLAADAVVVSADSNAVAAGLLGPDVAGTVAPLPVRRRSLSAVTFCLLARTGGFPLARHNVFFSRDYPGEFAALAADRVADDATVYVCAQDRDDAGSGAEGTERLFCLVNAPPLGDRAPLSSAEIDRCTERTFARLAANGLRIDRRAPMVVTTPTDFAARFPGTGGALYGPALHGPMAAFRRPVAATGIAGLYLAGGSVHPGPGVPMATLSGRMAAARLLADLASTRTFQATAMPGGISMPSVTTAGTASR